MVNNPYTGSFIKNSYGANKKKHIDSIDTEYHNKGPLGEEHKNSQHNTGVLNSINSPQGHFQSSNCDQDAIGDSLDIDQTP